MCFLFILETIIGAVCNLYVIAKRFTSKKTKSNTAGRNFTTTLKFMDLIISVTAIPMTFVVLVLNKEPDKTVCFLKESFVMFASSGSSLCILFVSIDRYCAVVLPTKRVFTMRRALRCKIIVFAFASIGFVLPSLCLTGTNSSNETSDARTNEPCRYILWLQLPYFMYELFYIVSLMVSSVVVFLTYFSVLKVVRRRTEVRLNAASSSTDTGSERLRHQEMKATRVTYSVVVTFLICWGPHAIVTIIQMVRPDDLVVDLVQVVCLFIAFLTTIIHPVIYTQNDPTNSEKPDFTLNFMMSKKRVLPDRTRNLNIQIGGEPSTSISCVGGNDVFQVTSSSTKSSVSNEQTV